MATSQQLIARGHGKTANGFLFGKFAG